MTAKGLTIRRAQKLRSAMTPPEIKLWQALRSQKAAGWRFRRQHPLGPWIVDFYCLDQKLAVEVDGWSHNMGQLGRDERRDADLARRGVRVIRFTATDVMENVDGVVETIIAELGGRRAPPS